MPDERRILVFLPNWVGDVVMATPSLRALREHFAAADILHVGNANALQTLHPNRWADATLVDHSRLAPRLANTFQLAARLRQARCDAAILLPNSFRTAAIARLAAIPRVIGYNRDARGWLLTERLGIPLDEDDSPLPTSAVDYYLDLVRCIGVCPPHGAELSRRLELDVAAEDLSAAEAMLAEAGVEPGRPRVMLNPGAAFGPSKMWSTDRFAAVADALAETCGAQIIIHAAPSERATAGQVEAAMARPPALSFAGRRSRIGLLKGLLSRCDLLITNDTGARHVAAALAVAVVTLFGSTDPRWSQIDHRRERIIRVDVPCGPCRKRMCPQPAGPHYHRCMDLITPEMVLAAARALLGCGAAAGAAS